MAKRYHHSKRKEHITAHDRAVDRRNLEHARAAKSHSMHDEHDGRHESHHVSAHDRMVDRRNLEHARAAKSHKGHDPRHISAHDRMVDRRNLEHARAAKSHHSHHKGHDPRHISAHDRMVDRENLMKARAAKGYHAGHEYGHMHGDSGMISDDMSAPALLPTHIIDKPWPSPYRANDQLYVPADLFSGVNEQLEEDHDDFDKEFDAAKY